MEKGNGMVDLTQGFWSELSFASFYFVVVNKKKFIIQHRLICLKWYMLFLRDLNR